MSSTYLYKAAGDRGKYGIFLTPSDGPRTPPVAILPNGQKLTGQYINTNEGRHQFTFGTQLFGFEQVQISVNGQAVTINPKLSYEGTSPGNMQYRHKGDLGGSPAGMGMGMGGGMMAGAGAFPGALAPSPFGAGMTPGYLGGAFPQYAPVSFNPVSFTPTTFQPVPFKSISFESTPSRQAQTPDYQLEDPAAYAKGYADTNRNEFLKNFQTSKNVALDSLDTELQGLKGFAPGAAALSRELTSADNQFNREQTATQNTFNQGQRTAQLRAVIPDVLNNLKGQTQRADSYAAGRLPDEGQDRALELGLRSESADRSSAAGFGPRSAAASKASDLMSARERLQISQFGEELTTNNANTRSNLELAPLQYTPAELSAAGSQIRVNPTRDAGSIQSAQASDLTQNTTINPTNALGQTVQQKQFGTQLQSEFSKFNTTNQINNDQFNSSLKYNTKTFNSQLAHQIMQFNASTGLQNAQFNSTGAFQASQFNSQGQLNTDMSNSENLYTNALGQFSYDSGYSQTLAGLGTAEVNNEQAASQRDQYMEAYNHAASQARRTGNWEAAFNAIGSVGRTIISALAL